MINNPDSKQKLHGLSLAEIATCKNLFALQNIQIVIANQLIGNIGGGKSIHESETGSNVMLLNTNSVVVAYDRTNSVGALNQKQDLTRTDSVEA